MNFEPFFQPVEAIDHWLASLLDGAPLAVALLIAFVLGLRHASDPDHLIAVTSLVAADGGDTRRAAALGAWWGLGHGGTLLVVGLPLILLKSELPGWLELGAERAVGVVILLLAVRVLWKWLRGDYRLDPIRSTCTRTSTVRPMCTAITEPARLDRLSASACSTGSPAPGRSCSS
jgi:ABC-type nickel/cobalt efflux system permease component RcnA